MSESWSSTPGGVGCLTRDVCRKIDGLDIVVEYEAGHDSEHYRIEGLRVFCGQRFFAQVMHTIEATRGMAGI